MTIDWPSIVHWLLHQLRSLSGLFVVLIITSLLLHWLNKSAAAHSKNRYQKQLLGLLVGFCGLVAIIATLPIAESLRNQLITLVGLVVTAVITLSSTNIAGNAMAGLLLRMLANYRPGDFVQVKEYFGRVTEQNLFHTEIQTEDRDLLTLPNMFMAANPVKVIHATGTIVSASVSLGYDLPRSHIQNLLQQAGEKAELKDVFVLITELGDFSIQYRVCGFLAEVKTLISARSNLRANILDTLHNAGIEIVSPNFMNQRQVAGPVIPKIYTQPAAQATTAKPEKTLFDKAERAQQAEELKDSLEEITEEIKTLEESLKGLEESEVDGAKRQLEQRKRRQKAMERALQYFQNQLER
ncbi:mechanosensitive ion channel family protein [Halioxenophilus sp. WMMB6]|uniref:mechanosensitive ion channel family protein n=1 Tax=Halioxenophilus sp. WMMB6 TaxID=3073815 RepID=UPI00295EB844|nr:mechanosensitive ion channel domain-containing protein [Halioxenophilus sp. WMMB6]